ncbi:MAG: hypothetical protein AAF723_10920 [Pseudomonadota bacterium]
MLLLATLIGIILLYIVIRKLSDRADARGGFQMQKRPPKLVEAITDPREAAALLLVQLAVHRGDVSVNHKHVIIEEMQKYLYIDDAEAEGLYSFGRMGVGQLQDVTPSLHRLLKPIEQSLTLAEMKDLIRMMETVALAESGPLPIQRKLIADVRKRLHLSEVGNSSPL